VNSARPLLISSALECNWNSSLCSKIWFLLFALLSEHPFVLTANMLIDILKADSIGRHYQLLPSHHDENRTKASPGQQERIGRKRI
jgi:hypothetical protein